VGRRRRKQRDSSDRETAERVHCPSPSGLAAFLGLFAFSLYFFLSVSQFSSLDKHKFAFASILSLSFVALRSAEKA
jgi:hypothetical protein